MVKNLSNSTVVKVLIAFTIYNIFYYNVYAFDKVDGICIGLMNYKKVNMKFFSNLNSMNINFIRVSVFWEGIEKEKGKFNWNRLDHIVNLASIYNKNVLFVIGYLPVWQTNGKYVKKFPTDVKAYENFLEKLVIRYKNKVFYYEVWNEPNLKEFWNDSFDKYLELLKISYKIIKQNNPNALVLNGGIAINETSLNYFKLLISKSAEFFDIIAVHFYYHWDIPNYNKIDLLKKILELAYKANKKVWITETGIPSGGWDIKKRIKGGMFSYSQAKELAKLLFLLKSIDNNIIDKVFLYSYKDNKAFSYRDSDNFGLLFYNSLPKPSFYTLIFLNSLLPKIESCNVTYISFFRTEIICKIENGNILQYYEKNNNIYLKLNKQIFSLIGVED